MRRALLLECGRFRAYVTGGEAHLDPAPDGGLQVTSPDDAKMLAEITAAIAAEMRAADGAASLNTDALMGLLRQQAMANQQQRGFLGSIGGLFGRQPQYNPFAPGGHS